MSLKASLSKPDLDALAEPLRVLYVEKDGKYVLDAEGLVPASDLQVLKTQVTTFRDTNTAVMKERDDLKAAAARFEGIDPDEAKTLKAEADKLKAKGIGGKADELQAFIDAAIAKANKPLVDELTATKAERAQARKEADDSKFGQLVRDEATKAGVQPQSVRFVLHEAGQVFELKDGALAPRPGAKHDTAAAWFQDLSKSDANLFAPSTGSGANGGGSGGKSTAKQLVNPTPEEMGRHMAAIAKGEMVVVRS